MTVRLRWIVGAGVASVALLLAGCSGDGEPRAEQTTPTTEPVVTAPPTKTPEEQAEEEILATFEGLISEMDEYYANASDYTVEELSTESPAVDWRVTGQAELELSNWTRGWRSEEIETVGKTIVATHDVTVLTPNTAGNGPGEATSVACRDLTSVTFKSYDNQPVDPSFESTRYQTWDMKWSYAPEPAPGSGINERGWYLEEFELTLDEPC